MRNVEVRNNGARNRKIISTYPGTVQPGASPNSKAMDEWHQFPLFCVGTKSSALSIPRTFRLHINTKFLTANFYFIPDNFGLFEILIS